MTNDGDDIDVSLLLHGILSHDLSDRQKIQRSNCLLSQQNTTHRIIMNCCQWIIYKRRVDRKEQTSLSPCRILSDSHDSSDRHTSC